MGGGGDKGEGVAAYQEISVANTHKVLKYTSITFSVFVLVLPYYLMCPLYYILQTSNML